MDIFSITSDFDKYRFLTFKNDSFAERANEYVGQSLKNNWKPIEVQLFEDKNKNDLRSIQFDASCFHRGQLWVKNWVAELIQANYREVEVLPISFNSSDDYYYINILKKIPALKQPILRYPELMLQARTHTLEFEISFTKNEQIFRDQIFKSGYYCTNDFIEFIRKNNIKGLNFIKEGVAK